MAVTIKDGLKFQGIGDILDKMDFAGKDGEQIYIISVEFWGGAKKLRVDKDDFAKCPDVGTEVLMGGKIAIDEKGISKFHNVEFQPTSGLKRTASAPSGA